MRINYIHITGKEKDGFCFNGELHRNGVLDVGSVGHV